MITRKKYAITEIRKAAQIYHITRNMVKTSRQTGIPRGTLQGWKDDARPEWCNEIDRVSAELDAELNAHYNQILEKSINEMKDRLERGDEHYDTKTGKIYRKRVNAGTLATMHGIVFDKQSLLRNQPKGQKPSKEDTEARLKEIAKQIQATADKLKNPQLEQEPDTDSGEVVH